MRSDFYYVIKVPASVANDIARRRSKKTMLTGAMTATFLLGQWQAGVALFAMLIVANLVQKNKADRR
ncbi:hypothetical protein [Enterococcus sp. AZ163]|uniref:hypothetical protein n=1 Tax=Enterococcus sp. AZ163 TaxID=2774638 RepID=UPI003D296795